MKKIISLFLALVMLAGVFSLTAYADPLDENGDTGGTGPGGSGSFADYWGGGSWSGMRITVIDVSDPARLIDGEQWGKVAAGTVSVDITGLSASSNFFTRTVAGDGETPLTYGSAVTHFGKVSKMAYRDGAALASTTGSYNFYTVSGCPIVMGSNQASAQTIKDFINNQGMLTQIAQWCGGGLTYESLTSGNYKLLVEPIAYYLVGANKYAFTATEAAMFKPHGNSTSWTMVNNTLANAFFLEYNELGWPAWTGPTNVNQQFDTIIQNLGMHIYSISVDAPPPPLSVRIIKKSDTGASLSGAQFTITGNGKNETITVNGSLTINLAGWNEGSYTVTEIFAPSGYELTATPQTFTITADSVSPAELTFINPKTPPPPPPELPPPTEVDFKKVEYGTEIGLAGAVFRVTQLSHWETRLVDPDGDDTGEFYDDDNGDVLNAGDPGYHHEIVDLADDIWMWFEIRDTRVLGTFISGADGSIPVGALEPGRYSIEEISPPAGYILSETVGERLQIFDVPREGGYEPKITFTNKKLPGLTVIKVDEDTGLPLAGAELSIAHKNGLFLYEAVTDASGTINLEGLPEGWYTITELAAPNGYLKRDESKEVFLPAGGSAQVKFDNRRKPTLEILKLDSQTGQPLSGATFRVWKTEGGTVGEYVTGADGKITVTDLEELIYSVEEIIAPDGYLLDAQHKDILLEWGKTTQIVYTDAKKPGLTISKYDEATGLPLAGAEFSVAHKGGAIVYEGQTGANGKIYLSDLAEGWYTVTETAAPYGYLIVNKATDVYLEGGAVVDVRFANRPRPALEIIKLDAQTGQPLAGARFKVWETESATVSEYVTDASGRIFIENLNESVYSVEEIAAPDGYVLDTQHKDIKLEWGKTKTLTYTNIRKPGLIIAKYDEATGAPLANAEFTVAHKGGAIVYEGQTDANGMIHLTDLAEGWYTVTETAAPDGYLIVTPSKDVYLEGGEVVEVRFTNRRKPALEIIKLDAQTGQPLAGAKYRVWETESLTVAEYVTDANGRIFIPNLNEVIYSVEEIAAPDGYVLDTQHKDIKLEWGKTKTLTYLNYKKPTLTIIKYDELTGEPLAGASFRLWKTEGETWSETQITGADGTITWTGLDPGIYSVQEIDEPYGYFKDPARKEILLNGGDNKQLLFFNRPRPTLIILKRDQITGEPIAGVKFRVQRLEGATIGDFVTDANGRIELSPATGYLLSEQVYRITEIQPPAQYLLGEVNVKDALLKWYEPTELIFDNLLKPTLIFIKTNGLTGRGISDATYKVEYEAPGGGIVNLGSYQTKCGLIVLPHVLPGWYILTETKAAPGYSLPTNPVQRVYLAPGENSYTYAQTHVNLYVDPRTDPNSGNKGMCGDCCGYLCSHLCAGNCGNTGFGGITITNGNGDPLGGGTTPPPTTPPDENPTTKPTLTAGAVTRNSDITATITFTSSAAGKYYYSVVAAGAVEPIVATSGLGTNCATGSNTITVYMTAGARDVYIKVKDENGNVSDALKISVPAYTAPAPATTQTPEPELPDFSGMTITGGTVVYLNPDFPGIKITFGNQ